MPEFEIYQWGRDMNDPWVREAEAKEQYLNDGFWPFSVPDLWYLSIYIVPIAEVGIFKTKVC